MKAIKDLLTTTPTIAPGAIITATATGVGVDLANAQSNQIVIVPGTVTDGVHTPVVQESNTFGAGYTTVDPSNLVGAFVPITTGVVQKVSYIGIQRYVRVVSTVTAAPATGGYYNVFVQTGPRKLPAP